MILSGKEKQWKGDKFLIMDEWKKERVLKLADEMPKPVNLDELSRISGETVIELENLLANHSIKDVR